jgi:hypothetical protein
MRAKCVKSASGAPKLQYFSFFFFNNPHREDRVGGEDTERILKGKMKTQIKSMKNV